MVSRQKLSPKIHTALKMKGRRESNINVQSSFMYSQKWNCYFQNRIIMFCLPVPTLIYDLWEIYIFPGSVCLYSATGKYVDRSWEYLNRSQTHEIGTEAAQFPEKEYINVIFLAVWRASYQASYLHSAWPWTFEVAGQFQAWLEYSTDSLADALPKVGDSTSR